MATVRLDDATTFGLRMLLYDIAIVSEERSRLDQFDSLVQTLPRCFDHTDRVRVVPRLLANVVGLVEIAVISAVVQSDVDVEDITVY